MTQRCHRHGDESLDVGGVPTTGASPFDEVPTDLNFPTSFPVPQTELTKVFGLSPGTISVKLKLLAELHGDREIFANKRVTERGFRHLRDLIECGDIRAYRAKVDADRRVQAAQSQVESPRSPQFPHGGTSYDVAAIPVPTLVPGRSIPGGYSGPLGLPVAPTQSLGYYQPTTLAQQGAGAAIAAQQLAEMLTAAIAGDQARTDEELRAIQSQRANVGAATAQIEALLKAGVANRVQAAVALEQQKNLLANEVKTLATLAQQAGVSLEGLAI